MEKTARMLLSIVLIKHTGIMNYTNAIEEVTHKVLMILTAILNLVNSVETKAIAYYTLCLNRKFFINKTIATSKRYVPISDGTE